MRWILSAVFLVGATAAQAAEDPIRSQGICPAVFSFIEAAMPDSRVRTALFYPTNPGAAGSETVVAMESAPHDDAADAFYDKVMGQPFPGGGEDFARMMATCLRGGLLRGGDFRFPSGSRTDMRGLFSFSTLDYRTDRRIDIDASRDVCPATLRNVLRGTDQVCVLVRIKGK